MHDRVVDNISTKPVKVAFNLTNNLRASKNVEKHPPNNKESRNKQMNSWATCPKQDFTPLGEPLDMVYKTLLHDKVISPLDNSQPYDPQLRPPWWNKTTFCEDH